ncbi:hypothetical protein A3742_16770 [Oleiphilus sp. HI0071]|uniref:hypothetical protein n=1 Tax=Oleiphilus sp. HI0080 TaxID=1822255 RepID=UPI0007C31C73|nr:hypothetical protein [Oleiphilus sp. HI0080]KZY60162.1 hypothetical protein A3737_07035 [Oleiphilus sp. HI0065]KZY78483.1 hypothetical protein A3742_15170 [Oleiphilus sp. HI0071]KZY88579.1 hypothetical protein A3744_24285 [Oleiphilus sp. HI0073]KZZ49091.1 hypothetical protein A3760_22320 [Oleiphilus sp. HI0122]KZY68557.1 hypothetical protein A3737_32370 [Oleiphilus sp. HI0065]
MSDKLNTEQIQIAINQTGDSALLESSRHGTEIRHAEIRVSNPLNAEVQKDKLGREAIALFVSLDDMDDFAIAWCKHRKLQGALGGPVGNEWGSPDCPYE